MHSSIRFISGFFYKPAILLSHGLLALALICVLSGCVSRINIPPVDTFYMVTTAHTGSIDVANHEEQLLRDLYLLLKANEDLEVPFCTALKDSKQCVGDGVSVFVQGGIIPGIGKRKHCKFKKIKLDKRVLEFTKDNSGTTFIGTPMYTRDNMCWVYVRNGGLQVEMAKYYATWAGMGHMKMAEGWAIDFIDLKKGIVGCQLELDIKGILTAGGGSRYVLLQFPNIPGSLSGSESRYRFKE